MQCVVLLNTKAEEVFDAMAGVYFYMIMAKINYNDTNRKNYIR